MPKILLVEDYESIRNVYAFAFTQAGFSVDTAGSGAEALQKVAKVEYDLICLDMVMLEFSGMEFLEIFRAKFPNSHTKVIVTSNIDSPSIMRKAAALGVSKYLIKAHFTPKQLVEMISTELKLPPAEAAGSGAAA